MDMPRRKIRTVRDLYDSMPGNVAYACLGKYYYKWGTSSVPEDEAHLCVNLNNVLEDLGYRLCGEDEDAAGDYNDIKGYMGCSIEEI
jgi:hypothetical protein